MSGKANASEGGLNMLRNSCLPVRGGRALLLACGLVLPAAATVTVKGHVEYWDSLAKTYRPPGSLRDVTARRPKE
jgi:hypothetical protein